MSAMPRLQGYRETQRLNVYDMFVIGSIPTALVGPLPGLEEASRQRLFGNANVGFYDRTNLMVPGLLACDQTTWLEHWYARMDMLPEQMSPRQRADLHAVASRAMVTLCVGDRPRTGWSRPLAELLADRPWEPASVTEAKSTPEEIMALKARYTQRREEGMQPECVPIRQNISVTVESFDKAAMARLVESLDGRRLSIWIHLEGLATRDCG